MKILLAHVIHSSGIDKWYKEIADAAGDNLEVRTFCVTLNPPGPRLSWTELNERWKSKDRCLLEMYQRLLDAASDCDVLLLYNGANIHPEFLKYLRTFNVYCCFDDPESSNELSAPVAASFDAVFYGNIASLFQYESWGCKKLAWLPIFTAPSDVPPREDEEKLLSANREIDISIICDKNSYREKRLEMLIKEFPQTKCYGNGWNSGKIDNSKLLQVYSQTKIGWNLHNSTGPINRRLFSLTGFGILQICDNKTGLGKIFKLGDEVIGFDTIPEAIEITRYYLEHESERRRIAANGLRRFWKDYHANAIWKRIKIQLIEWKAEQKKDDVHVNIFLPKKTISNINIHFLPTFKQIAKPFLQINRQISKKQTDDALQNKRVFDDRVYREEFVSAYKENTEMKCVNMAKERLSKGEPLEWPNMQALNWAITSLNRNAKKIIEIGSGTGPFAEFASVDPNRIIHCYEEDDFARTMAIKNRSYPNVKYFKKYDGNLEKKYDLLVSVDVIEHVNELRGFLDFCAKLAPRAIFTTPNREVIRSPEDIGPPTYPPHVREFNSGELYWILRLFYQKVFLYYMPDVYVPWIGSMTIAEKGTPIIAECVGPYNV